MEIAFIVVGIIVGLVIGLLVGRSKSSAAEARYAMLQDQKKEMETSMESALSVRLAEQKQTEEKRLAEQKAHYEETIANLKESFNAQNTELKARFNETIEKVTAQVKTATDTMLKERQKEFAENSNQSLGQIVNPLRETIDKMKKAMEENTEKQTSMSGEMRANIEHMMRQSMEAKKSADELTRVFKHGTKVQGDWGETVLDELLQSQGLTKGIHYDTQAVIKDATGKTVRSEEGSIMRPDVILHLDQRRELIIDSKVSLTAFIDYVNADNEDDRQHYLKAHIDSLQKHVKELSAKDYSSYIQAPKVKMDYVIMFVPHTGALWTALNAQPDLWRRAMEKNVFIADEQTLFAALRIINLTWTQIVQAQNHEKVFALANEMLNRVGQFWNEYEAMGKALEKAAKAYEDGKKKITDGGQSINTTANQLIKLGAKQSDRNPIPQLIDIDEIEAKE
jgi:DNA recombination protein RmuC